MAVFQPSSNVSCSSQSIPYPNLPGAQIRSLEAISVVKGWQYIPAGAYANNGAVSAARASFCNVTIRYTPLGSDNKTTIQVWLPTDGWNGRMQGVGGGGWVAGLNDAAFTGMTAAVIQGYAAIGTNSGYTSDRPADWALLGPGKVDMKSFQHYASTSLNDVAIVGKSIVQSYYGRPPKHSYWNGCSQGGRQGFMLAQRYPKAFDGIVASAPVVNWGQLMVAGFWAQMTMHELGQYPNPCELSALTAAAIQACDGNDGVIDGFISDPDSCHFDPYTLVNTTANCGFGATRKISAAAAFVAKTGWNGLKSSIHPYMWGGTTHEAALVTAGSVPLISGLFPLLNITTGLADSECRPDGTCIGKPFTIVAEWIKYFIEKDPNYDIEKINQKDFDRIFQASVDEYSPIIGTDSANLTAFRDAGGKLLSYHGLADSIIPSKNTRTYYNSVMAADKSVQSYFRHFEAPGVGHCYTGTGLYPSGIFDSLIKWVEQGQAPDVLEVDVSGLIGPKRMRILCPYPQKARYKGTGDAWSTGSYSCSI